MDNSKTSKLKSPLYVHSFKDHSTNKASDLAKRWHDGQIRFDKRDFFKHPQSVARIIADLDIPLEKARVLITAAYLHDVIEDTNATYNEILVIFGQDVADLVLEVTNNKERKNLLGKARYLSIKMQYMSDEALIIKLSDRLHNVLDLHAATTDFKNKIIKETLIILDYLLSNRKLTKVHLILIKEIVKEISLLISLTERRGDLDSVAKKLYRLI